MKRLAVIALVMLVVAGCGTKSPSAAVSEKSDKKGRSNYELIVGSKTVVLPMHENAKRIQDDIVTNVKPLWDNLDKGTSEMFYWQQSVPFDAGLSTKDNVERPKHEVAKKTGGTGRVSVAMKATRRGQMLRFFKNRNGASGLEQVDDKKNAWVLLSDNKPGWKAIDALLREQIFSLDRIHAMQQWEQVCNDAFKH